MADSFSIKFYLNKNKSRGKDEYKIYGRLIIDRKKSEFATNYYINETGWDIAKGRAKKNMAINDELAVFEAEPKRLLYLVIPVLYSMTPKKRERIKPYRKVRNFSLSHPF